MRFDVLDKVGRRVYIDTCRLVAAGAYVFLAG